MVNNYQEQRTIYNVIATIYGGVEPGRQALIAWSHQESIIKEREGIKCSIALHQMYSENNVTSCLKPVIINDNNRCSDWSVTN